MTMVYLGLFSRIFEWIWEKILSPIVSFVANLLGSLFEWVFNNILVPILTLVLQKVLPWFLGLLKGIFSTILYRCLSWIFKIIDYLNSAFDIFIGTSEVEYQGGSGPLLNAVMSQGVVSKAFWIITLLGIGVAMVLCIYAVAKSSLDFDFENKRPVGAVMRSMLKCFFQFLLIPFFVVFILRLSGIILNALSTALSSNSYGLPKSLGCILFAITSLDAAKDGRTMNLSNAGSGGELLTSGGRGEFYVGKLNYMDIEDVKEYFDLSKFDYLVGITMGIFLAVIMTICCITFIRRVFEVLTLYLVSPLFVSTMPLDDGEKFKKWREMFIAKVFGGYGSLVTMRLYLMLCPVIVGNSIQWGSGKTSADATYFIKLIFLVGGAWAMLKIGPMITSLLNAQAGQSEQTLTDAVGGMAGGLLIKTAGTAVGAVGSAIGRAGHKYTDKATQRKKTKDDSSSTKDKSTASNKYDGKKVINNRSGDQNENHTKKNKSTNRIL